MASFKEMEDSLKNFIIQEQSDAHNIKTANMAKYNNIKIAVWFSAADYDENGVAARPYWLDETDETLNAFKQGIEKYKE